MKTAIYIEDGVTQLVLTPESDWERSVLRDIAKTDTQYTSILRGTFYECQGGWNRQGSGEESLIIRINSRLSEAQPARGSGEPPTPGTT